jgi:sugar lactone lactonase YvrE
MRYESDSKPTGRVFRVKSDGSFTVQRTGIGITNTYVWSPDGTRFYNGDTDANAISVFDFDMRTGDISNERPFFVGYERGGPDGSAVDRDGYVWNARYGGGCVVRISPSGGIDRVVEVPTPAVTNCTFGGPDLKTLFITTARGGEGAANGDRFAGGLFAIRVEVPGTPENKFRLTT